MRNHPCDTCPFRSDIKFRGLSRKRAIEIENSLHNDHFFSCHKYIYKEEKLACIGSVLYLEKQEGVFSNFTYRLAALRGDFNLESLDYKTPIVSSLSEFLSVATIR